MSDVTSYLDQDDFYYAQHQLVKPGRVESDVELGLTESHLDDGIRALFKRSTSQCRQHSIPTKTARTELSVFSTAELEAVWPAWTAIKDALTGREAGVPAFVLFDDATAQGAFALAHVRLSYKLKASKGAGGLNIFPSISGRGSGEFAVNVNWHVWKAINGRKPAGEAA